MNSGPNQHYIPVFVQRAFGIPPRKREIWYFERNKQPQKKAIKRTGSQDSFYSAPIAKSVSSLDDEITEFENKIAQLLHSVRLTPANESVDVNHGAAIAAHLAPRTAHIRDSLKYGLSELLREARTVFSDVENIKALAGLDHQAPNKTFHDQIFLKLLERPEISQLPVPSEVIERMAFCFAKENASRFIEDSLPVIDPLFDGLLSVTEEITRDSHNKALHETLKSNPRESFLKELTWYVQTVSIAPVILPDCVVIAVTSNNEVIPFMLSGKENIQAVLLPISPKQLLVGARQGYDLPEAFDFNLEAARCSYSFFLSSCNDAETSRLHSAIAERSIAILNEAVNSGFADLRSSVGVLESKQDAEQTTVFFWPTDTICRSFEYELAFRACEDQELAESIGDQLRAVVFQLSEILPLSRLDGITVAGDYPNALREIKRGFESAQPVETIPSDIGIGIAQTVTVLRSGEVKGRLVISSSIGTALTLEDGERRDFALYVVVRQLVLVAMIELIEAALPETKLNSIEGELDAWLYPHLDAALHAYVASRTAAGFGDADELFAIKSELLADRLHRMRNTVLKEKLSYRNHGDLDRLLEITLPYVRHVLLFGADLLGHCASTRSPSPQESEELRQALEQAGLANWLEVYQRDLEQFFKKLGRWNSLDEFLVLNIHVERLLWQLGMIPWQTPEGIRVEIPFGTDADALLLRGQEIGDSDDTSESL